MKSAWLVAPLLTALVGCGAGESVNENWSPWEAFRERFVEGYFERHPVVAVAQGRHDFDGRLPDWSPEGFAATVEFLKGAIAEAEAFEGLDEAEAFEREYLIAVSDGELFWIETARQPFKNPFFYMHWALDSLDPGPYVTREYAPLDERLRAYIQHARGIPEAAAQIRANLETPVAAPHARMASASFSGLADYLANDVPGVFREVSAGSLQQQLIDANTPAVSALRELAAWFGEQEKLDGGTFVLGAELFQEMVARTERLDVPLERLREVGLADLERNRKALEEACAELAPGRPIAECIARVQDQKPEGGALEGARRQLGDLRTFLRENDVVDVPAEEEALVRETPPHMRWNTAFIDIPGPYEKDLPSLYYISPPDPSWPEEKRRAYVPGEADLLFTSIHEVWPGHFLHGLHSQQAASNFARVFGSYAFTEGWAHYAEEMMWEAGYGSGDPAVHVGQLLNALLRNARYVAAIGLHTGEMTLEEAETFFVEQAYQDRPTAEQQALRGTFDPAYLNYTLGKLMLLKLREDWTAKTGDEKPWRTFHDRVLGYGGPPVPLLRKALLGEGPGPAL